MTWQERSEKVLKRVTGWWKWEELTEAMPPDLSAEDAEMVRRLRRPEGRADVVLDTDTYNEIDDQYALAYLIRSEDKLSLKALYAAPFFNAKSESAGDGMEKSYQEILKVLALMEREDLKQIVYRGSKSFLKSETAAVDSDAARDLAERAMKYTPEQPLYVIAIGAITNVASALLMKPEIRERIVVVWLGGNAASWPHTKEFNMRGDYAAARIVFGCGVPVVQLPCMGVVSEFRVSGPELEYHLRGKNRLCDYLVDITTSEARSHGGLDAWTRVIWDVTAVAWLLGGFMDDCIMRAPLPGYDGHYVFSDGRHLMRYVYQICRDKLAADLFRKLAQ